MIYVPENIEGGGGDTLIRGLFNSLEEATRVAQDLVDRETFQEWLDFPINFKLLYDKGDRTVYSIHSLEIMSIPFGQPIVMNPQSESSVTATLDNQFVKTHIKYEEYKLEFELHKKVHKMS